MVGPVKDLVSKLRPRPGPVVTQRPRPPAPPGPPGGPPAGRYGPRPQAKNAAIVYAGGSLVLYCFAFYNLATAAWFNGLVMLLPATCLAYLAYRYSIQDE